MKVIVKSHAIARLKREKVYEVNEQLLTDIVNNPDEVLKGKKGRLIVHKVLDDKYILRVIYETHRDEIQIVTFYRARKKRYYRGGRR